MNLTQAQTTQTEPANQTGPTTTASRYQDTKIDTKIILSALWATMMFVFIYVDHFSLLRADVLESLLEGEIANTPFEVNQGFLIFTLFYILPASLMVFFSLTMPARRSRVVNIVVAGIYMVTIIASCIGEDWAYYLIGSAVEVVLLGPIIRSAWRWPLIDPQRPVVANR